jgi:hypothetical protein
MRFALMEGVAGGSSGTTLYFDTGTIGPWTSHHFLGRKLANSTTPVAWPGLWRSSICRVKIDNKYLSSWNWSNQPAASLFCKIMCIWCRRNETKMYVRANLGDLQKHFISSLVYWL